MLFKKIVLSSALLSIAGLVACGDDSSSSGSDDTLPEKVKTIQEANSLKCDESVKCAKVFVEEEMVNDYFQCDGERWQPATDPKFNELCAATEEEKKEGDEAEEGEGDKKSEGSEEGENSEGGNSTADSSDSNGESSADTADSSDSGESSADTGDNSGNSASSEELTGPTGDVVSCLQEMTMEFGGETISTQSCSEIAASSENAAAMQAACQSVEGFLTATLGTGCPTPYTKKCVIDNENVAYFYEAANATQDCADLIQEN
jgi:hypothetical protein